MINYFQYLLLTKKKKRLFLFNIHVSSENRITQLFLSTWTTLSRRTPASNRTTISRDNYPSSIREIMKSRAHFLGRGS